MINQYKKTYLAQMTVVSFGLPVLHLLVCEVIGADSGDMALLMLM